MKKIYFGIAILLACTSTHAQYKKASFLNKSGRTYDLGFTGHFLSGGRGTAPGIYYSYGRDKGKKIFHWFDLEVLLPATFKYNTFDKANPATAVTVNGKSKLGLAYRYNFAYYLADAENTESKLKPFAAAGINFFILGGGAGDYEYTPAIADAEKVPDYNPFSYGCNAGLGTIYTLSEKIGIKVTAGYNLQGRFTAQKYTSNENSYYKVLSSHPYFGVGIRFIVTGDEE
jgi:hypothetical protein